MMQIARKTKNANVITAVRMGPMVKHPTMNATMMISQAIFHLHERKVYGVQG